jgi:hypothetical protein
MLQENCSCAHGSGRAGFAGAVVLAVAALAVWRVIAAGYGRWLLLGLFLAGWVTAMGACALWSNRRHAARALLAATAPPPTFVAIPAASYNKQAPSVVGAPPRAIEAPRRPGVTVTLSARDYERRVVR